jgi:hypothetical protein
MGRHREGPAHVTDTTIQRPTGRRRRAGGSGGSSPRVAAAGGSGPSGSGMPSGGTRSPRTAAVPGQGGAAWEIRGRAGAYREGTASDQTVRSRPRPDGGRPGPRATAQAGAASPQPQLRVPAQPARERPAPAQPLRKGRKAPGDHPSELQRQRVPARRLAASQRQGSPAGRTAPVRRRGVAGSRPPGTLKPQPRPVVALRKKAADESRARAGSPVARAVPRVPFVLLVLGLLGGSLVCLLVINTTLGAASFRISQLQKKSASLSTQEQNLRQQVAAEQAPAAIAQRAYALGMRAQSSTTILDLRSGQIYRLPGQSGVGVELGAPLAAPTSAARSATTPAATPAATPKPGAGTTPAATPAPAASPAQSATNSPPAGSKP